MLPFANLNGDPARQHFAEGLIDALITELARIRTLRVISRQSVLHLKGSTRKLDEIADELSVDGIVEGAVLHEDDRVRVTAQLILAEPERHVWAQSYTCDMSAVLTTQREAARAIAASVATAPRPNGAVTPTVLPAGPEGPPASPEIIETFLKAMTEVGKQNAEGLAKSLQYFREITAKAPDFALGLAGHASCLFSLGFWGHAPAREVFPAAKQMLLNALAIDENVAAAHMVLGHVIWLLDWDVPAADREFRRAIELSPSNPEARIMYSLFLCCLGRHAESTSELEYGLRLNPTSLLPNQAAAWHYLFAGDPERAEVQVDSRRSQKAGDRRQNALQANVAMSRPNATPIAAYRTASTCLRNSIGVVVCPPPILSPAA